MALGKQGSFPFLFQDLETKELFSLFFHCSSMEKQKPSCSVTVSWISVRSNNGLGSTPKYLIIAHSYHMLSCHGHAIVLRASRWVGRRFHQENLPGFKMILSLIKQFVCFKDWKAKKAQNALWIQVRICYSLKHFMPTLKL